MNKKDEPKQRTFTGEVVSSTTRKPVKRKTRSTPERYSCGRCGDPISKQQYELGDGLCGACDHVMSKDD